MAFPWMQWPYMYNYCHLITQSVRHEYISVRSEPVRMRSCSWWSDRCLSASTRTCGYYSIGSSLAADRVDRSRDRVFSCQLNCAETSNRIERNRTSATDRRYTRYARKYPTGISGGRSTYIFLSVMAGQWFVSLIIILIEIACCWYLN